VLGTAAILRRDVPAHEAWMMRAYALGLGAGTQVLTGLPWLLAFGEPGVGVRAALMGSAWLANILVAEWVIARRAGHSRLSEAAGTPNMR
jgi:hypothetical protein